MLLKLVTLLGLAMVLYGAARRAAGLFGGAPREAAPGRATEMIRCRTCGAWHEAAERCRCAVPPTP